MNDATPAPTLITARQLATRLNVNRGTVYRWADRGLIPLVQLSPRCVRFNLEDCEAILKRTEKTTAPDSSGFIVTTAGTLQKKPVHLKRFSATVRSCNCANRPHLKWVVHIKNPGKRLERRYFRTKQLAESEANARRIEADNFGLRGLELTPAQRIEALAALDMVRPYNVTLTDVAREFLERRKGSMATFSEVASQFIESRRSLGRSERHLSTLNSVLRRAKVVLGERRMSDISSSELQDWTGSLEVGPRSRNHLRTLLHGVFEFARRRKIVRENPAKDVERHRVPVSKVGILTPDEMKALLGAAKTDLDVLATIAIGGFAGLRPEEIKRLRWAAIDLEGAVIDCGSEITKTAQHRYVKIEPVLAAWLRQVMSRFSTSSEAVKENIQSENFRRRYDVVRAKAGFSVRGSDGAQWPHDALRHSFGSYHLAHFKNAANTALEMGHEGTKMLFQNYRARVAESAAAAWWTMLPTTQGEA